MEVSQTSCFINCSSKQRSEKGKKKFSIQHKTIHTKHSMLRCVHVVSDANDFGTGKSSHTFYPTETVT